MHAPTGTFEDAYADFVQMCISHAHA
jgi:hypothetical protein